MTELVLKTESGVVTTSLLIAEKFDKEHKDVLEAVRNLVAKNSAAKFFVESSYENRGKQYPMYIMNRDGFSLLVMGFNGDKALKFKLDFIEAFNQMENSLKQLSLPSYQIEDPISRASKWIEEYKVTLALQNENDKLKPIASIAMALTHTNKEYGMSEVAKIMEVTDNDGNVLGRNKFFKSLRIAKILMDDNEPYQKYIDNGYFIYKTNRISNGNFVNTCYVTGKGLAWLQHNKEKIFK
jgi:anti-repressor protein